MGDCGIHRPNVRLFRVFSLQIICGRVAVIPNAKYAKSHEYAAVDGDVATIGISDFAQVRN